MLLKWILFEPITVGEMLTFLSSIILVLITWKSVKNAGKANDNARRANEITKESLILQRDQFNLSIKPDLVFDIEPIRYNEDQNDKHSILKDMSFGDHMFLIRNVSSNICYNISATAIIYMDNEGWDKYKSFSKSADRPNIVTQSSLDSLSLNEELECSIPFAFTFLNVISYDGTVNIPDVYVFIRFEDKTGKAYEECYNLYKMHKTFGKSNGLDEIEVHFHAKKMDYDKVKSKVHGQKIKLESAYPHNRKVIYYDLFNGK